MSEVALTQQLELAIEAMLANRRASAAIDSRLADLLGVAAELRDLPRREFKSRLRTELERETSMTTAGERESIQSSNKPAPSGIREGFRTLTPYVVVQDVHATIEFLKQAFDAEGQVYGLARRAGSTPNIESGIRC